MGLLSGLWGNPYFPLGMGMSGAGQGLLTPNYGRFPWSLALQGASGGLWGGLALANFAKEPTFQNLLPFLMRW
jgi:hypothetical protein